MHSMCARLSFCLDCVCYGLSCVLRYPSPPPSPTRALLLRSHRGMLYLVLLFVQLVWVTGADHGIGEQVAINLTVNGAKVGYE